jgi:hypothetical protein
MTELPERRGFDPAAQKNFDALKNRLNVLEAAGGITDTQLASPNNSVYRTILTSAAAATGVVSITTTNTVFRSNGAMVGTGAAPVLLYLDDADYTVAGKSTKLRVRAQALTNAAADPNIDITFGLYPITGSAGGAGVITETIGTVTSGSTVAITNANLNTSDMEQGNSGDFTFPADGYYALGCVGSGTQAANSFLALTAQLQMRHV